MPGKGAKKLTLEAIRVACEENDFTCVVRPLGNKIHDIRNGKGTIIAHYDSRACRLFINAFTTANRASDVCDFMMELNWYFYYPEEPQ